MIKYKTIRTQLAWPNSRQKRGLNRVIDNYDEGRLELLTKKLDKSVLAMVLARAASKLSYENFGN